MDIRFLIRRYISEGWSVVPIPKGEKGPRTPNWQATTFTEADFDADSNCGVRLGEPSGWLTDVDLDAPEAVRVAAPLLLATGRIHGRPSKPQSHYFYFAEGSKAEVFKDVDGATLVEIRSNGQQTVLPPSVHPSGEQLYWEQDREPGKVDFAGLRDAVRLVATAALLARHWPKNGPLTNQHATAGYAAGFLAARGLSPDRVETVIALVAEAAGDDNVKDRAKFALDTATKFRTGAPIAGGPQLEEELGPEVVARLHKWWNVDADAAMAEVNKRWFLVDVGDDTVVGEEVIDHHEGRSWSTFRFRDFAAFRRKLIKQKVKKRKKDKKSGEEVETTEQLADVWLGAKSGRQYDRLVYAPPGSGIKVGPKDLDGWRGFTVQPAPGDWSKNKAHVRDVVCGGDARVFEWVLDWCAALFAEPGKHAETAIVLQGGQGTGKGHFADVMLGQSFDGRHYRTITNQARVLGNFNEVLSGLCLLFLDEAGITTPEHVAAAKTLITGHVLDINRKYIAVSHERSMLHVIMASNSKRPIPVDQDDRRYCLLRVADARKQDRAYFNALHAELESGGRAAMLHELLHRRYSWDDLRQAPSTDAKREAKRSSWTPAQVFLANMIETTDRQQWADAKGKGMRRLDKEATVSGYLAFRQGANARGEALDLRNDLTEAIREHVPEGFAYNRNWSGEGRKYWTLPAYDDFRVSFAKARGIEPGDLADLSASTQLELPSREPVADVIEHLKVAFNKLRDDKDKTRAGRIRRKLDERRRRSARDTSKGIGF